MSFGLIPADGRTEANRGKEQILERSKATLEAKSWDDGCGVALVYYHGMKIVGTTLGFLGMKKAINTHYIGFI